MVWLCAVHSLVQQQPIVDYMATVVCIAPIMTLMSRAPNCLGLAAETLKNLFERQNPEKGTSWPSLAVLLGGVDHV